MTRRARLSLVILLAASALVSLALLRGARDAPDDVAPHAATTQSAEPVAPASDLTADAAPNTERAHAAATAVTPSAPAAAANELRTLRVRVVRADTHAVVAACQVQLSAPIQLPRTSEDEDYTVASQTDASGVAEFSPPARRPLSLNVGEPTFAPGAPAASAFGFVRRDVEPLEDLERRELTIELPVGLDLVFCGRAVAATDRAPIERARVLLDYDARIGDGGFVAAETDSDGYFEVRCASWRQVEFAVEANGFAAVRGGVPAGHGTRALALEIPLKRAARLEVQVLVNGVAPATVVTVELTASSFEIKPDDEKGWPLGGNDWAAEDPRWVAQCDARGVCVIESLPPRVPLSVTLHRAKHADWKPEEPLSLLPGETRAVTWDLAAGTRLAVRVVDLDGKPVARRKLWLSRRGIAGPPRAGQCYFYEHDEDDVIAMGETDAEGACVFDAVASGNWWVGPGPVDWEPALASGEVCAVGSFVEIVPGGKDQTLELRVARGATISGRVVDPDGRPVDEGYIRAQHASVFGLFVSECRGAPGEFVLGPLAPGRHTLVADGAFDFLESEPVEAVPGGEPVVLRLRRGATFAGTVFDHLSGLPVQASVLYEVIGVGGWSMRDTDADGKFEHKGQAAGRYNLTALTEDGKTGTLRDVDVGAGAARDGLRIDVRPGAWIAIEYHGAADYGQVELRSAGAIVGGDGIARGARARHLVPAGHVQVELRTFAGGAVDRHETQEFDVAAGETKEVVFRLD